MEKEYKWRADEALLGQALLWAASHLGSQSRTIHMRSQYFDTADGLLHRHDTALRLRRENEQLVCCMKRRNVSTVAGMRAHEEYECEAGSIEEGLSLLPAHGAPHDICALALSAPLVITCEVDFRRCAILLQQNNTVCELALDEGELRRGERTAPLCEIELELIAGDEAAFHTLASDLANHLSLIPEPQSKLARALAL
ncbi:MAG: inorganic triphosphatase [Agathobaculum sp.]|jgi:inorganic triphosphatase YgiF|uniref:inorganic triphosphatase n=1 Tax=Agathobaculum sp. TaxID=2048138 RepID=UPI003D8BA8E1